MEWLMSNWESIVAIVTGIVTVASVAAKMTPTEVDDNMVGRIIKFLDFLALNNKPTENK